MNVPSSQEAYVSHWADRQLQCGLLWRAKYLLQCYILWLKKIMKNVSSHENLWITFRLFTFTFGFELFKFDDLCYF